MKPKRYNCVEILLSIRKIAMASAQTDTRPITLQNSEDQNNIDLKN